MDRIDLLESKVRDMIVHVQRLNTENTSLRTELVVAREQLSALSDERQVLDQERGVVRDRIEQLLGDIEGITGNGDQPSSSAAAETPPDLVFQAATTDSEAASAPTPRPAHPVSAETSPFRAMDGGRAAHTGEATGQNVQHDRDKRENGDSQPINPVLPGMN